MGQTYNTKTATISKEIKNNKRTTTKRNAKEVYYNMPIRPYLQQKAGNVNRRKVTDIGFS